MRLVVALGGNALLRRDQAPSAENQIENIRRAAAQLARIASRHELVVTHGNGPQIGLLAIQSSAYDPAATYSLDVLGAQTDGMIGYLLEQELSNALPPSRTVVTLLTRVEVDAADPAFQHPSKPIGPMYSREEARRIGEKQHWTTAPDGQAFRRVVASPRPVRVLGGEPIAWLLDRSVVVIAAGGGGIPVARGVEGHRLHGVDAVVDKDLCSGLLAHQLDADCLVIATDVEAVFLDWGLPSQRALTRVTAAELSEHRFPDGSMGPKVEAACQFVIASAKRAVIGSLDRIEAMLDGEAGTQVVGSGARLRPDVPI